MLSDARGKCALKQPEQIQDHLSQREHKRAHLHTCLPHALSTLLFETESLAETEAYQLLSQQALDHFASAFQKREAHTTMASFLSV